MISDEKPYCGCVIKKTADSTPVRTDYVKIQKDSTGEWFVGIKGYPVYTLNGTPFYLREEEIWSSRESEAKIFADWAVPCHLKMTKHIVTKLLEQKECLPRWYNGTYTPKQIYVKLKF